MSSQIDYSTYTKEQLITLLAINEERFQAARKEQQASGKLLIRRDLALSRANEQLRALDIAKSEFISVAAHQLRTPLSAIKWILSMATKKEFKSEAETLEFLNKAAESCQRMIMLVNDLLEVDHIQSGKDRFVFAPVNLKEIIGALFTEFSPQIETKKLHPRIELQGDCTVIGDTVKLRALFQNLIENAIKYTPDGGAITVIARPQDNKELISVSDTGIGIPADQKSRMFSKFFRAQNAIKTNTVGSGLGLFIAKEIIERHGGKMWFESPEGKGTTFFVELPKA